MTIVLQAPNFIADTLVHALPGLMTSRFLTILLAVAFGAPVMGQPVFTETVRLIPHPDSVSRSGNYVAIDGDHLITTNYHDRWSVESYRQHAPGAWTRGNDLTKIQPQSTNFGVALAIDGHHALALDPNVWGSEGAGFAYRYDEDAHLWVLRDTLVGGPGARVMGEIAALDGDEALLRGVLSPYVANDSLSGQLALFYEWAYDTWTQTARAQVPVTGYPMTFWETAALAGDFALTGDRGAKPDSIQGAGAVHAFARDGNGIWAHDTVLVAPVPFSYDEFGVAVELADRIGATRSQTVALVGAIGEDFETANEGGVHVWVRSPEIERWVYEAVLWAPDRGRSSAFGYVIDSVTRPDGSVIVVIGSPFASYAGLDRAGAAYVFVRSPQGQWDSVAKLIPSDPIVVGLFGATTGITIDRSGVTWVAVGYSGRSDPNAFPPGRGGTYLYDVSLHIPVASGSRPSSRDLELAISPNPVRQLARITYALATPGTVRLSVHDALGREVAVLHDGRQLEGEHTAEWRPDGLAASVYLVRLATEAGVRTAPITVVR